MTIPYQEIEQAARDRSNITPESIASKIWSYQQKHADFDPEPYFVKAEQRGFKNIRSVYKDYDLNKRSEKFIDPIQNVMQYNEPAHRVLKAKAQEVATKVADVATDLAGEIVSTYDPKMADFEKSGGTTFDLAEAVLNKAGEAVSSITQNIAGTVFHGYEQIAAATGAVIGGGDMADVLANPTGMQHDMKVAGMSVGDIKSTAEKSVGTMAQIYATVQPHIILAGTKLAMTGNPDGVINLAKGLGEWTKDIATDVFIDSLFDEKGELRPLEKILPRLGVKTASRIFEVVAATHLAKPVLKAAKGSVLNTGAFVSEMTKFVKDFQQSNKSMGEAFKGVAQIFRDGRFLYGLDTILENRINKHSKQLQEKSAQLEELGKIRETANEAVAKVIDRQASKLQKEISSHDKSLKRNYIRRLVSGAKAKRINDGLYTALEEQRAQEVFFTDGEYKVETHGGAKMVQRDTAASLAKGKQMEAKVVAKFKEKLEPGELSPFLRPDGKLDYDYFTRARGPDGVPVFLDAFAEAVEMVKNPIISKFNEAIGGNVVNYIKDMIANQEIEIRNLTEGEWVEAGLPRYCAGRANTTPSGIRRVSLKTPADAAGLYRFIDTVVHEGLHQILPQVDLVKGIGVIMEMSASEFAAQVGEVWTAERYNSYKKVLGEKAKAAKVGEEVGKRYVDSMVGVEWMVDTLTNLLTSGNINKHRAQKVIEMTREQIRTPLEKIEQMNIEMAGKTGDIAEKIISEGGFKDIPLETKLDVGSLVAVQSRLGRARRGESKIEPGWFDKEFNLKRDKIEAVKDMPAIKAGLNRKIFSPGHPYRNAIEQIEKQPHIKEAGIKRQQVHEELSHAALQRMGKDSFKDLTVGEYNAFLDNVKKITKLLPYSVKWGAGKPSSPSIPKSMLKSGDPKKIKAVNRKLGDIQAAYNVALGLGKTNLKTSEGVSLSKTPFTDWLKSKTGEERLDLIPREDVSLVLEAAAQQFGSLIDPAKAPPDLKMADMLGWEQLFNGSIPKRIKDEFVKDTGKPWEELTLAEYQKIKPRLDLAVSDWFTRLFVPAAGRVKHGVPLENLHAWMTHISRMRPTEVVIPYQNASKPFKSVMQNRKTRALMNDIIMYERLKAEELSWPSIKTPPKGAEVINEGVNNPAAYKPDVKQVRENGKTEYKKVYRAMSEADVKAVSGVRDYFAKKIRQGRREKNIKLHYPEKTVKVDFVDAAKRYSKEVLDPVFKIGADLLKMPKELRKQGYVPFIRKADGTFVESGPTSWAKVFMNNLKRKRGAGTDLVMDVETLVNSYFDKLSFDMNLRGVDILLRAYTGSGIGNVEFSPRKASLVPQRAQAVYRQTYDLASGRVTAKEQMLANRWHQVMSQKPLRKITGAILKATNRLEHSAVKNLAEAVNRLGDMPDPSALKTFARATSKVVTAQLIWMRASTLIQQPFQAVTHATQWGFKNAAQAFAAVSGQRARKLLSHVFKNYQPGGRLYARMFKLNETRQAAFEGITSDVSLKPGGVVSKVVTRPFWEALSALDAFPRNVSIAGGVHYWYGNSGKFLDRTPSGPAKEFLSGNMSAKKFSRYMGIEMLYNDATKWIGDRLGKIEGMIKASKNGETFILDGKKISPKVAREQIRLEFENLGREYGIARAAFTNFWYNNIMGIRNFGFGRLLSDFMKFPRGMVHYYSKVHRTAAANIIKDAKAMSEVKGIIEKYKKFRENPNKPLTAVMRTDFVAYSIMAQAAEKMISYMLSDEDKDIKSIATKALNVYTPDIEELKNGKIAFKDKTEPVFSLTNFIWSPLSMFGWYTRGRSPYETIKNFATSWFGPVTSVGVDVTMMGVSGVMALAGEKRQAEELFRTSARSLSRTVSPAALTKDVKLLVESILEKEVVNFDIGHLLFGNVLGLWDKARPKRRIDALTRILRWLSAFNYTAKQKKEISDAAMYIFDKTAPKRKKSDWRRPVGRQTRPFERKNEWRREDK